MSSATLLDIPPTVREIHLQIISQIGHQVQKNGKTYSLETPESAQIVQKFANLMLKTKVETYSILYKQKDMDEANQKKSCLRFADKFLKNYRDLLNQQDSNSIRATIGKILDLMTDLGME